MVPLDDPVTSTDTPSSSLRLCNLLVIFCCDIEPSFEFHCCKCSIRREPFPPRPMIGTNIGALFYFLVAVKTVGGKTLLAHFPVVCALLFAARFSACCTTCACAWSFDRHISSKEGLTPELSRTAARHGGVVHATALSRAAKRSRLERIVRFHSLAFRQGSLGNEHADHLA